MKEVDCPHKAAHGAAYKTKGTCERHTKGKVPACQWDAARCVARSAKSPRAKSPRAKSPRAKSPRAKLPRAKSPRAKLPPAKSSAKSRMRLHAHSIAATKAIDIRSELVSQRDNMVGTQRIRPVRHHTSPLFYSAIEALEKTPYAVQLSLDEVARARQDYVDRFPKGSRMLDDAQIMQLETIDQGSEGACSFVGFLNNLAITPNGHHVMKPSMIVSQAGWQSAWDHLVDMGVDPGGAEDIAETLQGLKEAKMLRVSERIRYVPVRTRRNREQNFHTFYWTKNIDDLYALYGESYDQQTWSDHYTSTPWMFQNAYFVEGLIQAGIAVTINALEHTRTCVGYNDTMLLFADNWGDYYKIDAAPGFEEDIGQHFEAGYSVINKWVVYAWMRDLVYIQPQA